MDHVDTVDPKVGSEELLNRRTACGEECYLNMIDTDIVLGICNVFVLEITHYPILEKH